MPTCVPKGDRHGISTRCYIIESDGTLKRVPQRVRDALPSGADAIPMYAGTRQRVATVVLENDAGKPRKILDVRGEYWDFDAEGRIDEGLRSSMAVAMDFLFSPRSPRGKVVDLVPEIKKKDFNEKHRWEITNDDLDRIAGRHLAGFQWPGWRD